MVSSHVTVVTSLHNSGSRNSKLSRIQPGSNATTFFAYALPWHSVLPLLSVMRVILCIYSLILFPFFLKWSLHFTRQVMNLVWATLEILNKLICNYMVVNHKFRMNDKLSLFDCNNNKEIVFFILLKCIQFFKFNSSINLSFLGSPRNERSTYINAP